MAKGISIWWLIAVIATGLACLTSSAQNNSPIPNTPWYFPPVPQSSSQELKKPRAKKNKAAAPKGAQNPQDAETLQPDLPPTIFESQFQPDPASGLMKLDVVVTDQQGKFIAGLGEKDLTLLDNLQPRDIVTFQAFDNAASKPDPPVEIILVIDELDTPAAFLSAAEQAAQKFLTQNGGHLAQAVMVYRIRDDGLFASAQPSTDGNALAREVAGRSEPRIIWRSQDISGAFRRDIYGGSSPRFRAVPFNEQWSELPHPIFALGSIAIQERRTPGRKLLFWVGAPWPIKPMKWRHLFDTVTELSTRLREARIAIWFGSFWQQREEDPLWYQRFLPGVTSEKSVSMENIALQVLAVQSGGGELQGKADAADLISRRANQANIFYTVTIDPQRTEVVDEYHDLKIAVAARGLIASTITGYYDEPSYYDQPRAGVQPVTVAQLRDSMTELQHASDSEAARRLKHMELTERLSSQELATLHSELNGKKAKEALIAVADQSAFIPPPAEETLNKPPPGMEDQRQIMRRTVSYVSKVVRILPELSAERSTTLYFEPSRSPGQTWKTPLGDHSLDPVGITKASVHVSAGKEIVQQASSANSQNLQGRQVYGRRSLDTEGIFGPVLAAVLVAVGKPESRLTWARWERGDNGPLAVFRYDIPGKSSIFHVGFCCLAVDFGQINFENDAPTFGEIAIDPVTGTIYRLTVRAHLSRRLPLQNSAIMIEYGPVILGGASYTCPIRSVAISRQRSLVELTEFGEKFIVYGPFETILDDLKYDDYHLFHSSSRVLPGFSELPGNK
jgi:VWFA-related protein